MGGGGKDASWPKLGDKAEIECPGHAVTPEFRQVSKPNAMLLN